MTDQVMALRLRDPLSFVFTDSGGQDWRLEIFQRTDKPGERVPPNVKFRPRFRDYQEYRKGNQLPISGFPVLIGVNLEMDGVGYEWRRVAKERPNDALWR